MSGRLIEATLFGFDGTERRARAFTTLTPGLIVNESLGDPGWCVTHERSGLLVTMFDDPEQAQAFAADMFGVTDWLATGGEIAADPNVPPAVLAARLKRGYVPHHNPSEDRIARAERLKQ